jgi:hypothetical protein
VAGNVTLQSGSTNFMELNKSLATSDQVRATAATATTITYGGTLSLTNLAGNLAASDTFKLFSATNYSGAFSAITPATPAPGLGWNTNTLVTDGILRFVTIVNSITFSVSGNTLNLSWPADHLGWTLQTNSVSLLATNQWFSYPGSSATTNVSITLDQTTTNVFFRLLSP